MKTTITVEIDIEVEFTPIKGEPQTHWEPGYPDEIEDVKFDEGDVIDAINKYLESDDSQSVMFEEAYEHGKALMFEEAEYRYEQKKDAEIEQQYNKGD